MKKFESAGGIIMNQFNEIAMVFTDTKSWQFPKGTIEDGENYFDTAVREIEEETGLIELEFIQQMPMYNRISKDKSHSRDIYYFFFKCTKQILIASREISYCEWIAFNEVYNKLTYKEDKFFLIV